MKTFTKFMLVIVCMIAFLQEGYSQFLNGDVFVAVANGSVQWRRPNGTLVSTLNTTQGGYTTGMAFDASGNLYVTNFSASSVSYFDGFGVLQGTIGSGYSTPESIVFDNAGNFYVGNLGNGIRKFSSTGTYLGTSYPGRVDFMDLESDQCTMYRDVEGTTLESHNVCTNVANPTFASGLGGNAYAFRIIPTGPYAGYIMLGNGANIKRITPAGTVDATFDVSGEDCWFALNLDPDGTTFWSADFCTANVYRMRISDGSVVSSFNTGTGGSTVFGLAVKGEITAATILYINTLPKFAINPINTQHCVTSTIVDQNGVVQPGVDVDFVVRGCNAVTGTGVTNASGQVQFCYTGGSSVCCDTIFATIRSTGRTDTAIKCWDNAGPVEMSAFTSTISGNDITLNWSTSAELNNSGFDVERKSSSNDWTKLGFVQGSGTTNEPRSYTYSDRNLGSGRYSYRLKQIDMNGNYQYHYLTNDVSIGVPDKLTLHQNYPNPFNPETNIEFELPNDGKVTLSVYDNNGKLVSTLVNDYKSAGYYSVRFSGSNLSSGTYFYKLETNGFSKVMKMALIK